MAKVYAANQQYTGVSASVSFVNGVGECADPRLLAWFRTHGYTVADEEIPDEEIPEETHEEISAAADGLKPLSQMNKAELLARAAEIGITAPDGATNDAIRALIQDAVKD